MIDKLKSALAVVGALLAAIGLAFLKGRSDGAKSATQQAKEADTNAADAIRSRADAARAAASDDPISVLKAAGRIRND